MNFLVTSALTTILVFLLITPELCSGRSIISQRVSDNEAQECEFQAIFNFGDSNSDTGGLAALYGPPRPPNGETFFGRSAGRFCDGRLIIDFLAESLGLPYLSAYLNSLGSNFSHGANFATAGSTVRPQTTTIKDGSPISLNIQSAEFSAFQKTSQIIRRQGGIFEDLMPKEEYFGSALYTFDIGQNDLTLAGYKLNMSSDQVKAIVPDVVSRLAKVVRSVYALGGRTFWVHNIGPMGCLPYMLDDSSLTVDLVDKFGCAIPFNEVAQFYNTKLKETVDLLQIELASAAFTYVDVYSVKYTLIARAEEFGFEEPLGTCCGTGGGKYNFDNSMRCGSTKIVDGKKIVVANSCKNPSVKVIWDGIHYTEAANKWIFDQIRNNVSYSDPPIPLKRACRVFGESSPDKIVSW